LIILDLILAGLQGLGRSVVPQHFLSVVVLLLATAFSLARAILSTSLTKCWGLIFFCLQFQHPLLLIVYQREFLA
jgi:hypothetical protein